MSAILQETAAEFRVPALPDLGFWGRVDQSGDCWIWTGPLDRDGYGKFWDGQRYHMAHRFAFISCLGSLREHYEIDHLCFVRACVNPSHLEQVTRLVNQARRRSRITHCRNGHEYTPENTIVRKRPDGSTARNCRTCVKYLAHLSRRRRSASRAKNVPVPASVGGGQGPGASGGTQTASGQATTIPQAVASPTQPQPGLTPPQHTPEPSAPTSAPAVASFLGSAS